MSLSGKVALITGAASGIGKAQAIRFARAQAKIVALDLSASGLDQLADEIRGAGGEILPLQVDLTDHGRLQTAVQETLQIYSRIDILSNNAGLLDGFAKSLNTSEELWDRILNINLKAVFRLTNLVLPGMIERRKGVIINIASVAGLIAGAGGAAYTASKHALIGYTRQLSHDYGRDGIRANAICPGMIDTAMTSGILKDPDSKVVKAVRNVSAGRYGTPEDIANVALFLAGDEADFIHGAAIVVDGGMTIK